MGNLSQLAGSTVLDACKFRTQVALQYLQLDLVDRSLMLILQPTIDNDHSLHVFRACL